MCDIRYQLPVVTEAVLARRGCIFESLSRPLGPVATNQSAFREHRSVWPLSKRACDILLDSPLRDTAIELLGEDACIFNDQVCRYSDTWL